MIRLCTDREIPAVKEVFDKAVRYMRSKGNMHQWTNGYPSEDLLKEDIEKKQLYVYCDEKGGIHGAFVFFIGEEPTYKEIYEGSWLNEKPYGVMHRVASDGTIKHAFKQYLAYCLDLCDTIKIDTHRDNLPMQKAVTDQGFVYCGIIYLENGDERLAYQYTKAK